MGKQRDAVAGGGERRSGRLADPQDALVMTATRPVLLSVLMLESLLYERGTSLSVVDRACGLLMLSMMEAA